MCLKADSQTSGPEAAAQRGAGVNPLRCPTTAGLAVAQLDARARLTMVGLVESRA